MHNPEIIQIATIIRDQLKINLKSSGQDENTHGDDALSGEQHVSHFDGTLVETSAESQPSHPVKTAANVKSSSSPPSASKPSSHINDAQTGAQAVPSEHSVQEQSGSSSLPQDNITDTIGAIAIDCFGNIAAGSSSGGIGMKHRGRVGPAALVGIGTAVIPVDPKDPDETSVATVTSGTGEHIATTLAASTCANRVYFSDRKNEVGMTENVTEDEAIKSMIETDFMGESRFNIPM
jgi:isoaspartyl peptidase/L-asparaginase-like protein (Ntn-hydrolase superfamily)